MLVETLVKYFENEGYISYTPSYNPVYLPPTYTNGIRSYFFFLKKDRYTVDFNSSEGKVIGRVRVYLNSIEITSIKIEEMISIIRDKKLKEIC